MKSLLEILLLPKRLYEGITDRKATLYLGILFIGLVDIITPSFVTGDFPRLFSGKPSDILFYNAAFLLLAIIVTGAMDVVFFSIPLLDLFKFFKKQGGTPVVGDLSIRMMKIYITAHFLMVPVNVLLYFAFRNLNENSNSMLILLAVILDMLILVWFSGIIARGVNVVFRFELLFKQLVFIAVFIWNFLLGTVLGYMINNWIMKLFR